MPNYIRHLDEPITGLRIGVDEGLIAQAEGSVQARLETALEVLEKAGATRVSVKFPDWGMLDRLTQLLQLPEVASAHGRNLRRRGADFGPQVRARTEFGHFVSGADHQTALRARGTMLGRVLRDTYADCDVTILPTFADPLPTIAALDVAGGPQLQAAMGRVVLYCRPVNYLGLPALTLPYSRGGSVAEWLPAHRPAVCRSSVAPTGRDLPACGEAGICTAGVGKTKARPAKVWLP